MASVADFLIERLSNAGLKHLFGVSGPSIDPFLQRVQESGLIKLILTDDENHAALAADAYARTSGIGCVSVEYNVGALKLCNSVALSYAERSPVIVISGAPAIKDRNDDLYFHHVVKNFDNQLKIFKSLTCGSSVLDDPTTAGLGIDQVLESLSCKKQPVYIELPVDVSSQPLRYDVYRQGTPVQPPTNQENLTEAFAEISQLIEDSQSPLIIAGVQIKRFGLGDQLVRFAEKHEIPFVATLLSKSFASENHRLFSGVFCGKDFSDPLLNDLIEKSDCLLVLGDLPTDFNFGHRSLKFTKKQMAFCSGQGLKIKNHSYKDINFKDFCLKLFKTDFSKKDTINFASPKTGDSIAPEDDKLNYSKFFQKVSRYITDDVAIISDTTKILRHVYRFKTSQNQFLSSAFYGAKDYVLPAILGFGLANANNRIFAFLDSKSFQMAAFEIENIAKNGLIPIIFVIDDSLNKNSISINYEKITDLLGRGLSFRVETEDELCSNVEAAIKSKQLSVIHVLF